MPHWRSDRTLWEWGLRRAPRSYTLYTNLALVAVEQGNPTLGLALAEQALQRDPNEDDARNHRGLALFHLGEYAEAEAAFARAVELAPENGLYWSNLAGALREQGRLEEAERLLLDEALPRRPSLWVTHFNLGLVYLKADRPDLAVEALLQGALVGAPEDARLHHNLGLVAQQRGDTEAARSLFERAAELAPQWELPRENLEALEP